MNWPDDEESQELVETIIQRIVEGLPETLEPDMQALLDNIEQELGLRLDINTSYGRATLHKYMLMVVRGEALPIRKSGEEQAEGIHLKKCNPHEVRIEKILLFFFDKPSDAQTRLGDLLEEFEEAQIVEKYGARYARNLMRWKVFWIIIHRIIQIITEKTFLGRLTGLLDRLGR